MNQKKSKRVSGGSSKSQQGRSASNEQGSAAPASPASSPLPSTNPVPSNVVRTWLSIWVCFHLVALFLSFSSVVEPSSLHVRLLGLVQPYLKLAHFAADDRPVYLAHGSESEQPHRLEVTSDRVTELDQVAECQWMSVGSGNYEATDAPPGLAVSDRVARWLSTAATLAENGQSGVVAELLLPIAKHFPGAKAIRVVRFPTDLNDVNATITSPYVARIVRADDRVTLIQLTERRLSSLAVSRDKEGTQ